MLTRILLASATLVALAAPAAQASPLHKLFPLLSDCHFAFQTQCAINKTKGSHNKARIDQDQWGLGLQLGVQIQHGDGNNAYTGQTGTNQAAVTVQNGDNNTAFTGQQGSNQLAVTVQNSNGAWSAISDNGQNNVTVSVQTN